MATSPCPSCGTPNAAGARFCLRCGQPLFSVPPPAAYPTYVPPPPSGPIPPNPRADLPAISQVQLFAVLGLVGAFVGTFIQFGLGPLTGYSVFGLLQPGSSGLSPANVYALTGILLVSAVITIAGVYLLWRGYSRLRPYDPGLSTPSKLLPLLIVGLVLIVLGVAVLLAAVASLVSCAGTTTPPPAACVDVGSILGGLLLLLLGGILALIGVIGGVVLGLWRIGQRYDESMIKAGAILYLFPFLNILAFVLLLWSLSQVRGRLLGTRGPPFPPPF